MVRRFLPTCLRQLDLLDCIRMSYIHHVHKKVSFRHLLQSGSKCSDMSSGLLDETYRIGYQHTRPDGNSTRRVVGRSCES
jgi:hypothetical protein